MIKLYLVGSILSMMGMAILITLYTHKRNMWDMRIEGTPHSRVAIGEYDIIPICTFTVVFGVVWPVGWCILLTYIWLFEKAQKEQSDE